MTESGEQPQPPAVTPPPLHPSPPVAPLSGIDLSVPQRQSPLAVLFLVLRFVRSIGIVQIVVGAGFVLSRSPSLVALAIGIMFVASILLVISGLGWWRYTFAVTDGELRVEQGVISKQRLAIPLDRVQSVSIEQKLLHRIVDLVQVSADSAGTALSEFTIDAVKRPVAEALQVAAADRRAHAATTNEPEHIVHEGRGQPVEAGADRVVLRRTPRELVKIALTQFPLSGLAVLAPLFAFSGQLLDRIPDEGFLDDDVLPAIDIGDSLIWIIPLAVLAIMVFSMILNIIRVFLVHWDLTVTETASGLRKNAGLLSKSSTAASLPRLQLVRVSQTALTRLVGIRSVSLIGIRSTSVEQGAVGGGGTIAVPGCSDDQVGELRRLGLDGARGVPVLDRAVSPLEVFRQTRNSAVVALLLAAGLWWSPIGMWSLGFLLLVPWRWLVVRRQTRLRRWGVSVDAIANQTEFFTQVKDEALLRKLNSVTIRQSRFERKRGLATLSIHLAGAGITIGMIPIDEARAVRDGALFVAETDRRAFM